MRNMMRRRSRASPSLQAPRKRFKSISMSRSKSPNTQHQESRPIRTTHSVLTPIICGDKNRWLARITFSHPRSIHPRRSQLCFTQMGRGCVTSASPKLGLDCSRTWRIYRQQTRHDPAQPSLCGVDICAGRPISHHCDVSVNPAGELLECPS
jgi:hypothetical protein